MDRPKTKRQETPAPEAIKQEAGQWQEAWQEAISRVQTGSTRSHQIEAEQTQRKSSTPTELENHDLSDLSDLSDLWNRVAVDLRHHLGARVFDYWLKPISRVSFCRDSGIVTLDAHSSFVANKINDRFSAQLLLAWRQHEPSVTSVQVRANSPGHSYTVPNAAAARRGSPNGANSTSTLRLAQRAASASDTSNNRPQFDPRLDFDHFIVARSNILAASAAQRMIAESPSFNPLYIYSATGHGKTHLLHAIGQAFAAQNSDATTILMSAEKFMLEFVGAMRSNDVLAFKTRLRAADLLLLDDLQFVIGKGATQVELLHTIDDLMCAGKKLVVTADRPPAMLDKIEARLLSRLGGGLVADIEPPEADLRKRIIEQRLATLPSVDVPDEVVAYLVGHFVRNIRELEGALNKLLAYSSLTGVPIDLTLAKDRLIETIRRARTRITIEAIQHAVCAHYRLDKSEMASKRRARAVTRPRQIAMYLAKEMTPRSYPEIGRRFGDRDHSTVIHAVRAVEALRVSDSELDSDILAIRRSLTN